jgi:hypothetical protein
LEEAPTPSPPTLRAKGLGVPFFVMTDRAATELTANTLALGLEKAVS